MLLDYKHRDFMFLERYMKRKIIFPAENTCGANRQIAQTQNAANRYDGTRRATGAAAAAVGDPVTHNFPTVVV